MAIERQKRCTDDAAGNAHERVPAVGDDSTRMLAPNEQRLFDELLQAVQSISYGSIQLTIHGGRLVELSKTVRMRRS
jgi:hypothetical protein